MHRLLPLLLLLIALTYIIFNFQTLRRDFLYKFHLTNDQTASCCHEADVSKSNGNFDESASIAIFNSQVVNYPKTSLAYSSSKNYGSQVLGTTTNVSGEEKWIDVSLSEQRVRAYEGNKVVMEFPISSGLWAPTPIGNFRIWYKTRFQRMTGGSQDLGTFYDLPNVPNNMFFNQGYALHGAYWHNNFGHPMSHGCVNQPLANAAQIFDWAGPVVPEGQNAVRATDDNPGTKVIVH